MIEGCVEHVDLVDDPGTIVMHCCAMVTNDDPLKSRASGITC